MRLEEREIDIGELTAGMYVCRLDRPWTETPFPLQGFLVESGEQIELVRRYCRRVWIDVELGHAPRGPALQRLTPVQVPPSNDRPASAPAYRTPPARRKPLTDPHEMEQSVGRLRYTDTVQIDQELPQARAAQDNAARLTTRIIDDIRAGQKLASQDVEAAVVPIVKSVLRSADALFWVNALRKQDGYGYSHAINCSALAAAFGRHLGLPEPMLVDLASGGMLLDVGKAQLPAELLAYPGPYDAGQMAQVRTHVELSMRILEDGDFARSDVSEMVRTHHERFDGSGYPDGLSDTRIPLFGRMAAIIDSFDAMTSHRPHAGAMARHEALQHLYRSRQTLFQDELVEQFTSCLGIYPVGSLVELDSGEVAVVMAQNPARRLRPRVILLTDAAKQLRNAFTFLDLMPHGDNVPASQANIVRPLPPGAYGLDPTELYL